MGIGTIAARHARADLVQVAFLNVEALKSIACHEHVTIWPRMEGFLGPTLRWKRVQKKTILQIQFRKILCLLKALTHDYETSIAAIPSHSSHA